MLYKEVEHIIFIANRNNNDTANLACSYLTLIWTLFLVEKAPTSAIKCYYKDVEYDIGDKVTVDHVCSAACVCRPGHGDRP